jgi:hypothetical protein
MSDLIRTTAWFLKNNKKRHINMTAGMTLGLFLLFAAKTGMFGGYSNGLQKLEHYNITPIVTLVFVIFSVAIGSNICKDIMTKQQRTYYMMLPAKHGQKFWARILTFALLVFVVYPLAIIPADLLQMLISLVFTGDATSMTALLLDFSATVSDGATAIPPTLYAASLIAMTAWGLSSYILGGFLFRKMPILLTTLAWIVMWIVVGMTGIKIASSIIKQYEYIEVNFLIDKNIAMALMAVAAGTLFTVFNLWLSYKVHKRMSIITNKWLNI